MAAQDDPTEAPEASLDRIEAALDRIAANGRASRATVTAAAGQDAAAIAARLDALIARVRDALDIATA